MYSQLAGKVFFVTGADGFLGAHLTQALLSHGAEVIAQVRSVDHLKRLTFGVDRLTFIPMDFCKADLEALKDRLPQGIDVCVHTAAAGIKPNDNAWELLLKVNIDGTKLMLDLAVANKIKRFVYIGSSFEYGDGNLWEENVQVNPRTLYGVSKSAGWMLAKSYAATHQLPIVGFRPFYLYGAQEGPERLLSAVINALIKKEPLPMTLGEQERDFVHVDDAVRAILYGSIDAKAVGEVFNICTGEPITIRKAVGIMEEEVGQVFPLLWGKLPYRSLEWVRLSGSSHKAKQVLGFSTSVNLREGLKGLYEFSTKQK